ncbi:ATP-dependent Clp protease protease subunit [Hydrogenoanaerobacterium saccharovorans]|uniref:ATP-dependent Clp protease, protease subunit n=1 Tax=Hydrogenoanaerobacterium saccharovorans TaxID=474960 RepID=A0A1H8A097_9FIRM|nr:head maturation protease, ClpP-related [Hydrogenoanaerobacterium saccharovorans]RPF48252.1 ATP-dependent Clp protease protease subunit [Hydrogenoanaerobacterium saccharovorans]SEM64011.1 ATP-dependent Clp protease, protease subunit [Hydrogenoanaerobacterium saccharovorans]
MPAGQKSTQTKNKHFWSFRNSAEKNTSPELILYGDIASETWWGDEVTPKQFTEELTALGNVDEIVVRINSGGGDVFAANAIYTRLKDNPAKITVKIDGWAASAATIVAMAGDTIEIPGNGVFMVHDPKMGVLGYFSESEFVKLSEELKVIKQSIVNGYALKTGKDEAEIAAIMATETWYDGKQAVDAGFCDKLMFEEIETAIENTSKLIVNSVPLDISRFPDMPISLINRIATHTQSSFLNTSTQNQTKEERENMTENKDIKTVNDLKAVYPELTKQVADNAALAERTRIKDIEEMALDGFDSIVNVAKFEKPVAAADVAMQIVAEQKKQGGSYLANREKDVENSNVNKVENNSQEGVSGKNDNNPFDAAIDKVFPIAK